MWKSILFRRPLRRHEDRTEKIAPSRKASSIADGPFADLMEKLDRIPYRRQWKRAPGH